MKNKPESSTRTEREKKLNIFRFSIKPTLIKSAILFILLLLFYCVIFPRFLVPAFVIYVDQVPMIGKVFKICRLLFLVLIIFTAIRCLYINSKKIRIKKDSIMYRYGIIFKKTKTYSFAGIPVELSTTSSPIQSISNVCTVKVSGLKLEGKKKGKKLVFKGVKQGDELIAHFIKTA